LIDKNALGPVNCLKFMENWDSFIYANKQSFESMPLVASLQENIACPIGVKSFSVDRTGFSPEVFGITFVITVV
jgi:hypothetical protein